MAGSREFSITGCVWGLNGTTGALKPVLGGDNLSVKKPLAEYIKNILRGRKHHGFKVKLTREWAELAESKLRLGMPQALPRHDVKKARAGPQLMAGRLSAMLTLDSSDEEN